MLKLIGSAPALSANVVATNPASAPPRRPHFRRPTTVRDIDDARAVRVSNINADLPYAQWLTLNLLGGLLMSSFPLLTSVRAHHSFYSLSVACCAAAHALAPRFASYTGAPKRGDSWPPRRHVDHLLLCDRGPRRSVRGQLVGRPAAIEVASFRRRSRRGGAMR